MKQHLQSQISINWLVATVFALASASALAGDVGNVNAGGRSVNEVQGRASGSVTGVGVQSVHTASPRLVSEVLGRGNQMAKESGAPVVTAGTEVGDFGRGSTILAKTKGKQGQDDIAVAATK